MRSVRGTYQLLTSALADFRRDKVRTALTSLGIMIGVLSVVMLIALGLGLKNYIKDRFESLGASLMMVLPGSGFSGGGFGAGMVGGGAQFDEKDIKSLKQIQGLEYIVPIYMKGVSVEAGAEGKSGMVMAVNEDAFPLMNLKVAAGEFWTKTDVGKRSKLAVLGYNLANDLFDQPQDAVGRVVRIEGLRLRVVGVAEKTGDQEADRALFIPYTTAFISIDPKKIFWAIYLGVPSEDMVPQVSADVKTQLLRRYKKDDFSINESSDILSTVNQIFGILNLVLVAIGSISLLVGGIGIMNIMYATVTERTREVGIRRALGATEKDILLQFLTESMVLSFFGGLVGLLLAAIIVLIVRIWFPIALNAMAVILAFGVSSAIGIFFGVFPARKAANLSPIEAIRYE